MKEILCMVDFSEALENEDECGNYPFERAGTGRLDPSGSLSKIKISRLTVKSYLEPLFIF